MSRHTILSAIAVAFLGWSSLLFAQSADQQQTGTSQQPAISTHHQISVTGCLKRGGESGQYYLTDLTGKTWELTSTKVDLARHVFHTVKVAGKEALARPASPPANENEGPTEGSGNQYPRLQVIALTMLSSSCTR